MVRTPAKKNTPNCLKFVLKSQESRKLGFKYWHTWGVLAAPPPPCPMPFQAAPRPAPRRPRYVRRTTAAAVTKCAELDEDAELAIHKA